MYGKAHRKPYRAKGKQNKKQLHKATRAGEVVSVDQLESTVPGFVPVSKGKPTNQRYVGATVFVDHFSDFTYIHLMTKLNAEETVKAKQEFERVAESYGVRIRHYHADNGLFATKDFKESVKVAKQTISFCGVGAHHQNGIAERRIKDIQEGARTSLLHAKHRWPKAISASLWSAAARNYVNVRNALPTQYVPGTKTGRKVTHATYKESPLSKFSGTEAEPNLKDFHPFGSPTYVLTEPLQTAGGKQPKWEERARVGIFLCHSPNHATNVPLILNTKTGLVSPQFHVIYDDHFETVERDADFKSIWQSKAKIQGTMENLSATNEALATKPHISGTNTPKQNPKTPVRNMFSSEWEATTQDDERPVQPTQDLPPSTENEIPTTEEQGPESQGTQDTENPNVDNLPSRAADSENQAGSNSDADRGSEQSAQRASKRIRRPPKRFEGFASTFHNAAIRAYSATFCPQGELLSGDDEAPIELLQPNPLLTTDAMHPLAYQSVAEAWVASRGDPDTMTLEEALRQPDRDDFLKAMEKELKDHIERKHWRVVPISKIPHGRVPIPMVWSMKRKKSPAGEIIKHKARLCAGGHKQLFGVDYWDTYSPVVSWSTVRLILTTSLIMDWHMEAVDFVLAYPQAPVQTDIFMKPPKVPQGFTIPDMPTPADRFSKVYKLIKNLYGLKDAGRTWHQFLRAGLLKRGWKQSQVDECLFTKNGVILILYVDDAILIHKDKNMVSDEIKSLSESFTLTSEGEVCDYLGVRFVRKPDGSIVLSQPRLIERVCKLVGLDVDNENVKHHSTPAISVLQRDSKGLSRRTDYNYRSAVGCLSYLQSMSRPDITYAVQQCARFSHDPKRSHEDAIKRICRYLHGTKDMGMILRPDRSKGLECYVDTDWAGNWHENFFDDPSHANSRTGYIITYAGCPIVWASKMQSLIALSTTEAEYIALSTALREVIAILHLLNEFKENKIPVIATTPKITCRTFEDNKSCLEIATNHKSRPRTKHLSVRLHHFRSYVEDKTITIEHVDTQNQLADIFTKPLAQGPFTYLRDKIMGRATTVGEGV